MSAITWRETSPPKPAFTERNIPDQYGRVFIVTGGSSGCGYEIAKAVFNLNGHVHIAERSADKAQAAIDKTKAEPFASNHSVTSGKGIIEFLQLDLDDLASIKASAATFLSRESRLDVIWHNAGIGGGAQGSTTVQGFETHLRVNALGPFLFQHFLTPLCLETAARSDTLRNYTRVIWVTSSEIRVSTQSTEAFQGYHLASAL
ncbi:unnamed protein product [Clonostachys chloroleuca]|uniref:Uncharacterized protein n=1 Tax=Clonostachys chloroleuca TaxID=1926264 RepID=A0AA35M0J9_9HYPO|nr:unnamed protein product [Clonostachys chloroleuca]